MTMRLPQPFGRYTLLKQLSKGGMGRVYQALLRGDTGFEKQVAVKLLLKELAADREFVTRFADEARIACSLNHANIVQVFDFGTFEGEYFLTMEYVDGPDLGQLLQARRVHNRRLDVAVALYIAAGFCRGLAAAHLRKAADGTAEPVVHRDVSPQNVMISRGGEVKVTDFGIAKTASKAMRTRTGLVVGKCRYLAPEQALGEAVEPAADVFSAATVLFEMLAGRPLFDGGEPDEVMRAVVTADIPPLSSINPEVSTQVERIVERALRRTPAERPSHCGVLARDLERALRALSPDLSQDDIAALVDETLPIPVPQRDLAGSLICDETPANEAKPAGGPSSGALSPASAARIAVLPTERLAAAFNESRQTQGAPPGLPVPADVHRLETQLLAREGNASLLADPAAAGSQRLDAAPPQGLAPPPPTPLKLVALAALAGTLVGVVLALVGSPGRRPHPNIIKQHPKLSVERGPWRLRVIRVRQHSVQGRTDTSVGWVLRVHVSRQGRSVAQAGRFFRLVRGSTLSAPRFWQRVSGTQWRLSFVAPKADGPLRLRFHWPGSRPLELRVRADGARAFERRSVPAG